MDTIYIYCDGCCTQNQFLTNIGGWGAVVKHSDCVKEFYGGCRDTGYDEMELTSCIEALKQINNKSVPVHVIMNSNFVVQGMNERIYGWLKNYWRTPKNKPIKHKKLWEELHRLSLQFNEIEFIYCKNPYSEQHISRADELSGIGMNLVEY